MNGSIVVLACLFIHDFGGILDHNLKKKVAFMFSIAVCISLSKQILANQNYWFCNIDLVIQEDTIWRYVVSQTDLLQVNTTFIETEFEKLTGESLLSLKVPDTHMLIY